MFALNEYDNMFRGLVMRFLGRMPEYIEVASVFYDAVAKVNRIIEREGDGGGYRRTDAYLAQIVSEQICEKAYSTILDGGIENA